VNRLRPTYPHFPPGPPVDIREWAFSISPVFSGILVGNGEYEGSGDHIRENVLAGGFTPTGYKSEELGAWKRYDRADHDCIGSIARLHYFHRCSACAAPVLFFSPSLVQLL
jgi:hypothetical protein